MWFEWFRALWEVSFARLDEYLHELTRCIPDSTADRPPQSTTDPLAEDQ